MTTARPEPVEWPATSEALTPISFLRRSATLYPTSVAVVDGAQRTTYAEWNSRVMRQAGWLASLGVQPGDRVATLAPNGHMLLDAHYGVPLAGGVLLTLNIRLTASELNFIVQHAGVSVLLYDESLAELASRIDAPLRLSSQQYEAGLLEASELVHTVTDEFALLSLNYTSGTTGKPKGVMYHHRGAYLQALAMAFHGGLTTASVHLWTLPMFHCNGWTYTWAVTAAGGRHICLARVDVDEIWSLIGTEGVDSLNAAPTVLIDLGASTSRRVLSTPLRVGTGGSPPSPTLLERLGKLNLDVTHLYGLTETFGPSVICEVNQEVLDSGPADVARFKARQGNCNIVGEPLRVVADGNEVPPDGITMGEVQVRGNTVALGYYRDPEATAVSFGTGWFKTGDIAVMHPDRYVELRDRSKDIIISGGENVASIQIEQVLDQHPDVLESAVVAAPHERWGEVPVGFVSLLEGSELEEDDLIKFARAALPGFKTPKRIYFGPLPKTGTGKVQKYVLRSRIMDV